MEMPSFEPLQGSRKTDVLIIGGGLAGLLCAKLLQEQGTMCMLIEADKLCSGVSSCTTAKITAQHGLIYEKLLRRFGAEKARLYYDGNMQALEKYCTMCRSIDCDYEEKDAFVYSRDNRKKLEQEMSALREIGARAQFSESVDLPVATVGGICFPEQGQFHPLKFAAEIARDLPVFEHTRALSYEGKNTVLTNRGTIRAEKIITATHFPIFIKHGSYFLKLYQHRSYVLALENAPNVHGMYVDEKNTGLSFRNAGNFLLLGGGSHRTGKQGGNWKELEAHYPRCPVFSRWATQDCMTLDDVPYIGRYSRSTEDLFVATGFHKWGMTGAMTAAMVLRDLVLGKANEYAQLFSPSRSMLHKQLLVNALESTVNLLTPTKPRCPHMGCALKWNPQEHSWDCPCHGSRFGKDGKLLEGPANGNHK